MVAVDPWRRLCDWFQCDVSSVQHRWLYRDHSYSGQSLLRWECSSPAVNRNRQTCHLRSNQLSVRSCAPSGALMAYMAANRLNVFGSLGGKEIREAGLGNLGLQDRG